MRVILIALLLSAATGVVRAQATLNVPSAAHPTIQSAIDAAVSGDTILVSAGTYHENLVWTGKDIQLIGAGAQNTIVNGGEIAPCVRFQGAIPATALLKGFTLKKGVGGFYGTSLDTVGGGLLFDSTAGNSLLLVRDCVIEYCSADIGAAVWVDGLGSHPDLLKVEIRNCTSGHPNLGSIVYMKPGAGYNQALGGIKLRISRIHDNDAARIVFSDNGPFHLESCDIHANLFKKAVVELGDNLIEVFRTRVRDNVYQGTISPSYIMHVRIWLGDFAENVICANIGGSHALWLHAGTGFGRNVTISGNRLQAGASAAVVYLAAGKLANSIIWGNTSLTGPPPPAMGAITYSVNLYNCCIQDELSIANTTACVFTDPLLVDPANGDLRLGPGSPGIDAGTSNVWIGSHTGLTYSDLFKRPRVRGAAVDMGAIEAFEGAIDPAADGTAGAGVGGPYGVLLANGTVGNALREVLTSVGAGNQLALVQPPHLAGPVDFSIFGMLAEAAIENVLTVPLGVGPMSFLPAPLDPSLQPVFFTAASSIGSFNGVAPLMTATPTPWTSGSFSLPYPIRVSFQAVLEEAPGLYTVSNLVVLEAD